MRALIPTFLWLLMLTTPLAAKTKRVINPLLLELAKRPIFIADKGDSTALIDGFRFTAYSAPDGYWLPVKRGSGRSVKQVDMLADGETVHVIELIKVSGQYRAYIIPPACIRGVTNHYQYVGAPTECEVDIKKPLTAPWVDAVYLR